MGKLDKMLLREIIKAKGQFIAAASVILAGITLFIASYMSYTNLINSLDQYCETYHFLDYYAEAKSISDEDINRINKINGVNQAIGRISIDVCSEMGEDKRVYIRLISLPDDKQPEINKVHIEKGGYFDKDKSSCLLSQKFAEYYNLKVGDSFSTIINLKKYEFKIAGIVVSPEYMYPVKSANSIGTSSGDFGIMYVKESTLKNLTGMNGFYNQVHVRFNENADRKETIKNIEDLLKSKGFYFGVERKDHFIYNAVIDVVKQLENVAYMFPVLFLTVAALIIYISLKRIINSQRVLIGVLKALGYTKTRIMMHYAKYSLLISIVGVIPAIFLGLLLGKVMTSMYNNIFSIPVVVSKIYLSPIFIGVFLSILFCLLAGYSSAKSVLKIQPAEAMRSEVPMSGKRIILENIKPIWNRLSFGWKMSIRNVLRSPQRSLLSLIGISFTIVLFMVSVFFNDAVNYMIHANFDVFQKQDYKAAFYKPVPIKDTIELRKIKGINDLQPIAEIPVKIKNKWMSKDTLVVGISDENPFLNFIDVNREPIQLPKQGILIPHIIAQKLSIKQGDMIKLKSYMGNGEEVEVRVAGIIKKYMEFNCYMNINELDKLLEGGEFATGAMFTVEKGMDSQVKKELFKRSGITSIEARLDVVSSFKQFMDLMYLFIAFMFILGSIMGFSIIFNVTIISIMERKRELASLKVLGYTRKEIEKTIHRENMILGIASLIPGAVFGRIVCQVFGTAYTSETNTLEIFVKPSCYIIAFLGVFLFSYLSQLVSRKKISNLDMVEVLKNRES